MNELGERGSMKISIQVTTSADVSPALKKQGHEKDCGREQTVRGAAHPQGVAVKR